MLGLTARQLQLSRQRGDLRAVRRGTQWQYIAADVLLRQRETEAKLAKDPGERDALAMKLLREGATDGDVIEALRLPLERVIALRRAIAPETSTPEPASVPKMIATASSVVDDEREETRIREGYEERRRILAERRRTGFSPDPPPKRKGSS